MTDQIHPVTGRLGPLGYQPVFTCRLNIHDGLWGDPYLVRITTTTIIRGEHPRESIELVGEEQRQDRTCIHCGAVTTRRLR